MYDRNKVVEYAKKWAYKINPDYYDFTNLGGDCTNFVSQCVLAGNLKMDEKYKGWYYKNLYNRSYAWTGVDEFWEYGINNKGDLGFKLKEININEVNIGDIVKLYSKSLNKYFHCVIITKIIKPISLKNILVSAHDYNCYNRSLIEYTADEFKFGKIFV